MFRGSDIRNYFAVTGTYEFALQHVKFRETDYTEI